MNDFPSCHTSHAKLSSDGHNNQLLLLGCIVTVKSFLYEYLIPYNEIIMLRNIAQAKPRSPQLHENLVTLYSDFSNTR